jgi:hypothetical protein
MNQNIQHCFLLDGKTILPIDHNHPLSISLKKLTNIKSSEQLKLPNHKKNNQINNKDFCSCSLQSIKKLSKNKSRKFSIAKQSPCQHHQSDQQINNNNNNNNEIC